MDARHQRGELGRICGTEMTNVAPVAELRPTSEVWCDHGAWSEDGPVCVGHCGHCLQLCRWHPHPRPLCRPLQGLQGAFTPGENASFHSKAGAEEPWREVHTDCSIIKIWRHNLEMQRQFNFGKLVEFKRWVLDDQLDFGRSFIQVPVFTRCLLLGYVLFSSLHHHPHLICAIQQSSE